jgi:hypothetical protein
MAIEPNPPTNPRRSKARDFARVVDELNQKLNDRPRTSYSGIEQSQNLVVKVSDQGNLEFLISGSSSIISPENAEALVSWISSTFLSSVSID